MFAVKNRMFLCLIFALFFFLGCQKKIYPTVFYSIGENKSDNEKTFSTKDGMLIVSFPNSFGKCILKLFPQSSVVVFDSYLKLSKPTVSIEKYTGLIFVYSENCNVQVKDEFACDNCSVILKNRNNVQFEVIEGKAQYRGLIIRKGYGYLPAESRMYVLKPKINLVFPRNGQEVIIPLFLWEKKDDVDVYLLEFALDQNFFNPIYYVYVRDNKFFPEQITFRIFSRKIFWRIIYEDKNGVGGVPSDPQEMIVP
ncbi:MAG: hypothetical protein NZ927_05985 [Candidatus Calescibacterium sp.]|nr:hypothetical protein [Candidatus Calescibacterium sp.]MCX7734910.1 hypothetical protein [bacterium]MDW8087764.1 hypothetical protein [Candidatus Calescibacterium sp.]